MINPIYSPFIKSKAGEAKALIRLDVSIKNNIIPFFDILALKRNVLNGADVHEHVEKQVNNIAAAWNGHGSCYVDFFDVLPSARGCNGLHPVAIAYEKFAFNRIDVIPVVGIERDNAYKLAIRLVVNAGADALAIRLGYEDMQLPSMLVSRIETLVKEVGAANLPLHIFMDFRSIDNLSDEVIMSRIFRTITELEKVNPTRLVFAASAIVNDMGKFKKNSVNRVARREILIWEKLIARYSAIEYADYGVIHPEYFDIDPRFIKPAAKIRYACEKEWVIVKGIKWISDTSQHRELSKMLFGTTDFRGSDCWGAKQIISAASGGYAYRRLEDWVMIDQNSHITQTVKQMSRVNVGEVVSA